ncbi:hypothetical protein Plhal304r1_c003g0010621 [Plasmopara halstedii]
MSPKYHVINSAWYSMGFEPLIMKVEPSTFTTSGTIFFIYCSICNVSRTFRLHSFQGQSRGLISRRHRNACPLLAQMDVSSSSSRYDLLLYA